MARVRSPNYPALSLPEAIEAVRKIQAAEQHMTAPKEVVAKHLGYTTYHGLAGRIVSAIEKYGLLEEVGGDKVKVSPLAMSILFPATPEEKQTALNEAASKPPLFAAIKEEWGGSRPSDDNLRVYLVRRKFATDALDRVIEVYKETMDLVTPQSGAYTAPAHEPKGREQEKPAMQQSLAHQPLHVRRPDIPVDPYVVSISGGRLKGTFELTTEADAEELIRAIGAWKSFVKDEKKS